MKIVFVLEYISSVICLLVPYVAGSLLSLLVTTPGPHFWEAHAVIAPCLVLLSLALLIRIKRK